jgi:hypothetical protein
MQTRKSLRAKPLLPVRDRRWGHFAVRRILLSPMIALVRQGLDHRTIQICVKLFL